MTDLPPGNSPGQYEKGYRSMKVIDTPRTGRLGPVVFYESPFGQCCRILSMPRDSKTAAQCKARQDFGVSSQSWSRGLSDPARELWNVAAQTVPTHPSLNQYSRLSGQMLCVKINATLRCVSQPPTAVPPAPVVFSPNCVGDLTIGYDAAGNVQLLLAVGAAVEDIMLYGQAPCSAGRMKHRPMRHQRPVYRPVWPTGSRTEGLRSHLPAQERLEGPGARDQRDCPSQAAGR
jgi:hypothetical protein